MIRIARLEDIPDLHRIRLSVRENQLLEPSWLTEERTAHHLTNLGCGWVFEQDGQLLGFSIALRESTEIWALFLDPDHEGRGIGKALLKEAVNWLWMEGADRVVLSTDPGTRAELFYQMQGFRAIGQNAKGETRFELLRHSSDHPFEDQDRDQD